MAEDFAQPSVPPVQGLPALRAPVRTPYGYGVAQVPFAPVPRPTPPGERKSFADKLPGVLGLGAVGGAVYGVTEKALEHPGDWRRIARGTGMAAAAGLTSAAAIWAARQGIERAERGKTSAGWLTPQNVGIATALVGANTAASAIRNRGREYRPLEAQDYAATAAGYGLFRTLSTGTAALASKQKLLPALRANVPAALTTAAMSVPVTYGIDRLRAMRAGDRAKVAGLMRDVYGLGSGAVRRVWNASKPDAAWASKAQLGERVAERMGFALPFVGGGYLLATRGKRGGSPPAQDMEALYAAPDLLPNKVSYQRPEGHPILFGALAGGAVGAGLGNFGAGLLAKEADPLAEQVVTAIQKAKDPITDTIAKNVDLAEAGMRQGMQRGIENRLAREPSGWWERLLHRSVRKMDPVEVLALDEELGAFRNMGLPQKAGETLDEVAEQAGNAVRGALDAAALRPLGTKIGLGAGVLTGALLASTIAANRRMRRVEDALIEQYVRSQMANRAAGIDAYGLPVQG